jgi:outer membrane receptor for ferrienterochelin and colicin
MVLGGEIESFESTPKTELDNPLGEYNLDYENWGLFSQVEYEPNESLEFTAGLRYDHSSRYEDVWNPRLGAVCKPSSSVRLRGNWGTSYLAPVPHKVYERWGVIEDGEFVHLPNEDLRPEKLTSCEIGCGLFPTDDLLLEFAAFRIDCEDLMRIAFKGPITIDGKDLLYQTNENVAESEIWGAHVVADHQVTSQLRFDGHYTLTTGKQDAADIDSTEVDLNHMPKHMLEANATITHPWAELRLEGNWFDEITTHELNPGHAGACIDGAWTFDLTLSKRLNVGGTALGLALTVNNLFDKEYYKVPSTDEFFFSLPMVGQYRRTFMLTMTLGR